MIRRALAVCVALAVAACSYSQQDVHVVDDRPAIAVGGAPSDAAVVVDGLNLGRVGQFFTDRQVLHLEPGVHTVAIIAAGRTLLSEKVFLGGGEVRTLTVTGGGEAN